MKFDICEIFEHLSRKFKSHYNRRGITSTLLEDQYTFKLLPPLFCLSMKNFSDVSCRENQNTYVRFNNIFRKSCRFWGNVQNVL